MVVGSGINCLWLLPSAVGIAPMPNLAQSGPCLSLPLALPALGGGGGSQAPEKNQHRVKFTFFSTLLFRF